MGKYLSLRRTSLNVIRAAGLFGFVVSPVTMSAAHASGNTVWLEICSGDQTLRLPFPGSTPDKEQFPTAGCHAPCLCQRQKPGKP